MSFSKGRVPNQLKIAKVTPVFKNGDPSLIHNYRSISVLPVFSKIYERLMYIIYRLMDYVTKNNILSIYQFGFKKGCSTDMALTILIDKITNAMDEGEHIIGLFLDLAKAFATVNHTIIVLLIFFFRVLRTIFSHLWAHAFARSVTVARSSAVQASSSRRQERRWAIVCGSPQSQSTDWASSR